MLPYLYRIFSILNCGDSMTEERKHALLFAATILAARKLNDPQVKPRARGMLSMHLDCADDQMAWEANRS